ncbi:ATPase [Rossellomorea aquimaris]|uniref:ATPase n=1 Tax=Rossellomorea aquimaris TaxID=189382 RepID=A0A5D4U3T3_9BACI|nr:ATPase [Rossellomorea aquimaris]TYS81861.1 ATPase [Rossellomorea aquimaris]TYS88485.1 ATPase [Rossellomorea aquimaris]TYS89838.1 ATPase [Rossellomorea aquimaris]
MSKSFWLPLIAAIGTMVLLYVIGFIGNIEFLVFKISLSNTEIALLPIAIGIVVAMVSDRIVKSRSLE